MKISTTKQYVKLTKALLKKGYTTDTVYEALEDAGFSVSLKGETYEGIYASRVIAMMHGLNPFNIRAMFRQHLVKFTLPIIQLKRPLAEIKISIKLAKILS